MSAYAEIIGDPVEQSKSPLIHGFWLDRLRIDAGYRRARVANEPGALHDYLSHRRDDASWRGCNVTMPHKRAIIAELNSLDPLARAIGAVNTVVRQDDGSLRGYNTDVGGFLEPLRANLGQQHLFRMARIIGTGGAARGIVAGLVEHGFTIVLAGRDPAKASAILADIDPDGEHHTPPLSHFADPTDFAFDDRQGCYDLVINASPLGMVGAPNLNFDMSHAPPGSVFYDIVTSPVETPLLRNAAAHGFRTIDGLSMLIGQAAEAFELLFGQSAPREHDAALRAALAA